MVNSYRYVFAASTSTIPVSGTTVDLGIGEIGVFDGKTFQATNGVTAKSILIAQGTPDTVWPHGVAKSNHTYKTDVIKGSAVKSWKKVNGKKGSGMQITMGYDGVDTTKNLTVKQGKSFTYWVTMSGPAIANLLGDSPKTHYAVWTEQFTVQLPCVSECVDNCGDVVDPNVVADAAIDQFNNRKMIGGQYITDYVKVTKLVSCETPSGLPSGTTYYIYDLTIADAGDQAALGAVQAQYPGVTVKRVKRDGLLSTYEVIVTAKPADYEYSPSPVLQACDTCPSGCPSGYTLVEATDEWIITRNNAGFDLSVTSPSGKTAFVDAIVADYTALTPTGVFLSYTATAGSVKIYVPTGSDVTALGSDSIVKVATNQAICTPDEGLTITTEWVSCKECTTAKKTFTLTVANDCINTPSGLLDEIQAIYGDTVTISGYNALTCTTQFSLDVESNKDCEKCADIEWKFETPAPFKGLVWTEVQGENYGTDCNVGLKFESVYEQRKAKECFLKQVAYEFEPLFITVSTRNPDPNDYSVLCETDVPVTLVKNVEYPKGVGRVVADQVIASNFQYNQPWRKNAAERDAFEYELGIDLQGIYDQYILEFQTFPNEATAVSGFGTSQVQTFELSVFFPVGTGTAYETVVSAFVASNSPLALEVI
jgi:hypothetical protein